MPTRHSLPNRLTLLIFPVILLASSDANAGLFWPFRRTQKPSPPPLPAYTHPVYHPSYAHYPAAQARPIAWQQPYYPPMPQAVTGGYGFSFGERPALPAVQPPPGWQTQPQYQPVVYRPQPPPVPQPVAGFHSSGSLASMLSAECQRLARMGLRYQFGSMDPASGGLDCSGSVKCALERCGVRGVPRTASERYVWLQNAGSLTPLRRGANGDWILNHVRPGDLLFWRGTYVTNHLPDVSHVMIYLGRDRRTGKPMMFGARSNTSRTGLNGNAVDIYEFIPVPKGRSEFIGFGSVPR